MDIRFIDNSDEIKAALREQLRAGLTECGLVAEGYAKKRCPVDTGNLRNSISNALDPDGKSAYIGTNVEYAPYVELGTGKYYPGGRDTPWAYQDAKGNWHRTSGSKAQPFIKPAVADHAKTYISILKRHLGSG